jgi:hypothetical protein
MQPLIVILDILGEFLGLDQEHCYAFNQNWIRPRDGKLCLVGSLGPTQYFANNRSWDNSPEKPRENVLLCKFQTITVDAFSSHLEDLDRMEEILVALSTDEAETRATMNGFSLVELPDSFVTIDELDGSKILYRKNLTFRIMAGKHWSRPMEGTLDPNLELFYNH